jgi:hypothetical protein
MENDGVEQSARIEYFVKIFYYQYNSGAADNGYYLREERSEDLDKIRAIVAKLKDSEECRGKYVENIAYSGYVVEVRNICKREIKEELVETTFQTFKRE